MPMLRCGIRLSLLRIIDGDEIREDLTGGKKTISKYEA
jgi:hypothetical protein